MNGKAHITVNDNRIDLYYGLPASRMFFEALDKNTRILEGQELNEAGIATLLYCGYANACLINNADEILTRGDFCQYVDIAVITENGRLELERAVKAYTDSQFTKYHLEKVDAVITEIKKKASTGTASKVSVTENLD